MIKYGKTEMNQRRNYSFLKQNLGEMFSILDLIGWQISSLSMCQKIFKVRNGLRVKVKSRMLTVKPGPK